MPPAAASSSGMADELERLYDAHAQALFAFVLNVTRHEGTRGTCCKTCS